MDEVTRSGPDAPLYEARHWVTGQVISKMPTGHAATMPAGITHHQQAIFIIAPEVPTRKPDTLVERLYHEMDPETVKHIPTTEQEVGRYEGLRNGVKLAIAEEFIPPPFVDLKLETYVRVSSLSKDLQAFIREEIRPK